MPRVYMRFEWLAGWRVSFLDGSKVLPRTLLFRSDESCLRWQGRVVGSKVLADRLALEHAMVQGRGGVHLELSYPQLATLAVQPGVASPPQPRF